MVTLYRFLGKHILPLPVNVDAISLNTLGSESLKLGVDNLGRQRFLHPIFSISFDGPWSYLVQMVGMSMDETHIMMPECGP